MNRDTRKKWRHDLRNSLNGVICMGSLLEETELTNEQRDLVKYVLNSAYQAVELMDRDKEDEESAPVSCPDCDRSDAALSILVAEDDDINRLFLTTVLKQKSWAVDEAGDGCQAVELCRSRSYGMILMDVNMPGLDGFQASRQIRENGITTPIIATTAHSLQDLKDKIQGSGIDAVLQKPFTEEQLIETIRQLIPAPL